MNSPFTIDINKAANGNRTRDLRTTNATLYRLSYSSTQRMICYHINISIVNFKNIANLFLNTLLCVIYGLWCFLKNFGNFNIIHTSYFKS